MKNQELDTLDSALNRLGENSDTQTRLNLLKMLAEHFHGPIKPSDGISDDELKSMEITRAAKVVVSACRSPV
jgi:hypothetical protein